MIDELDPTLIFRQSQDGFTPLAVALQEQRSKVVNLLLDDDVKGRVKLPALHIAARKDDVKAAALILHNDHSSEVSSKVGDRFSCIKFGRNILE